MICPTHLLTDRCDIGVRTINKIGSNQSYNFNTLYTNVPTRIYITTQDEMVGYDRHTIRRATAKFIPGTDVQANYWINYLGERWWVRGNPETLHQKSWFQVQLERPEKIEQVI